MFTHQHYVPILKWKQGEYQALHRLAAPIKDSLTPLLEIPAIGFDHEAGEDRETIDSHLGDFGRRLRAKWPARNCFVDLKYIDAATRMADGRHYVEAVFADARTEGCRAIPVVSLASDAQFLAATVSVIRTDRRGMCLRLTLPDFHLPNLATSIATVLGTLGVGYADTDLIIDLAAPNYQPVNAFVRTTLALVALVPMLNRWRTFTVAGTSYPQSLAVLARSSDVIPRHEWTAYRALVNRLGSETRIPTFGDYAVAHPDPLELDMRFIRPSAKLRYTFQDHWHIEMDPRVWTAG